MESFFPLILPVWEVERLWEEFFLRQISCMCNTEKCYTNKIIASFPDVQDDTKVEPDQDSRKAFI